MSRGASLLDTAAEAIQWIRRQDPGVEAEVYLSRGREASIEFKEGVLESIEESSQQGTGLRVIQDGRQGFAYSPGVGLEIVQDLFGRVRGHLDFLAADPDRKLPGADGKDAGDSALRASLVDPASLREPLPGKVEALRAMEAKALAFDRRLKKALRSGYGESRGEMALANTRGLSSSEEGTHCSLGLAVVAEDGSEIQIGSGSDGRRFSADLDFERVAKDAAWRATALLDSRKLATGRRAVVLDPWVAGEFLDLVTGALAADQVQRGKSLLAGKLGKRIASEKVSFTDDPRRPRGNSSSLFDDEGVRTRRKTMVERGVLLDYFYDTYTASKDNRASNGSAGRASFRGLPRPGHSNFYLEPGKASRESLLSGTPDGVLVFEILGMHTANPVSGDFSVGVSGVAIRDGRLSHGVRGAMVSGNLLEVLAGVDLVADDLTFYGSLGAPTFRVQGLTVA